MTSERARSDLAVIGSGIVGMSAAITAAEAGATVEVIDAGHPAGSNANAGSLHVQLQSRILRLFPELTPKIEASLPLYRQAARLWQDLDTKYDGVELRRTGGLMVAETESELAFLHDKAERERRQGLDVDMLDRDGLRAIAPYLSPTALGAELCHDEGKVNPLIANQKLRSHALSLGVITSTDTIQTIQFDGQSVQAIGNQAHRCDQIILAAAWGTRALTDSFGLHLPVDREALHMNITEPAEMAIGHLVQHADKPLTLKQLQSGQIVVGGGWPAGHGAGGAAPPILQPSLHQNLDLAEQLVPGIGAMRVLRTWAGYNTILDGGSIIGRTPQSDRVIIAVPGDAGYTLGPLLGAAVGSLAVGEDPPFDTGAYSPNRFSDT